MNKTSRTITGTILIIIGLLMTVIGFTEDFWAILFYGMPMVMIGFFIFFNETEDHIEPVKKIKK